MSQPELRLIPLAMAGRLVAAQIQLGQKMVLNDLEKKKGPEVNLQSLFDFALLAVSSSWLNSPRNHRDSHFQKPHGSNVDKALGHLGASCNPSSHYGKRFRR